MRLSCSITIIKEAGTVDESRRDSSPERKVLFYPLAQPDIGHARSPGSASRPHIPSERRRPPSISSTAPIPVAGTVDESHRDSSPERKRSILIRSLRLTNLRLRFAVRARPLGSHPQGGRPAAQRAPAGLRFCYTSPWKLCEESFHGEAGIRTLGGGFPPQLLSRQLPSAARPPLPKSRGSGENTDLIPPD